MHEVNHSRRHPAQFWGDGPTDQRGARTDLQRSQTLELQTSKPSNVGQYVPDCILLSKTAALRSEVLRRTCFFHNLELLFRCLFLLRGYMHWQTPWIGFGGYGSFSWASFSPWVHECWAAHLPHTIHPKKGLPSDTQRAWAFSWWNLHPFSIALTHGQRPWQSIHSGLWAGAAYYVLVFSLHLLVVWCFQAWTTCAVWFQTTNKERFQRSSLTSLWKKNIYRVQSSLLWVLSTLIRWLDKWQTNLEYGPKTGVDATLKFWNICKGYDGRDVPTKVACCGSQHLCRTYDVQKSEGWLTFKKQPFQNVTSYVTSHRTSSAYRTKICWFHERNDAWNHVESIQIQRIQTVWIL